jgi:hypothetical protein
MDPEEKQVERQKTGGRSYDTTLGAKVSRRLKEEIEDIAKERGHPTVSSFLREVFEKLISDDRSLKNVPRAKLTKDSDSDDGIPPALI